MGGTKKNLKKRKYYRRKPYGTKAQFIPTELAIERYNNISTKTFYFKEVGVINSTATGLVTRSWNTLANPAGPNLPLRLPNVGDCYQIAELYNEYKVLAMKVRVFAANIGTEPTSQGPPNFVMNRGATVMYLDQSQTQTEILPIILQDVMTYGSCKMIPSRADKHTRVMYRPKDYPKWGVCDRNMIAADRTPDPWYASIQLLGNLATPSQLLWYYTVTYKIIFRGRTYTQ